MKKRLFVLITFFLSAAVIGGVAVLVWGYGAYQKPVPLQKPVLHIVQKGHGLNKIAERLAAENIITEPFVFRLAARLQQKEMALHAGEYEFTPAMSMADVLDKIARGDVYQRQVTFAEGLTSWQIVQLLNKAEGLTGTIKKIPPEGSLLPETYNYTYGESRQDKITRMQKAMREKVSRLWQERAENLPLLSPREAVILASIVEKETGVASERRRVAGVFINRLRKGMKLQTDPTVIYALTKGKIEDNGKGPLGRRLLSKDLQYDSPYNTYKYAGLPPGPIANPGAGSLAAVLNPEPHGFYYFVADGTGGHKFARTLEEHNRNVRQWRRIRDGGGQNE